MTKTAFVAIVGKPNVGKSSLLNKMLGQKIAIVSSKPQTTRTKLMPYNILFIKFANCYIVDIAKNVHYFF